VVVRHPGTATAIAVGAVTLAFVLLTLVRSDQIGIGLRDPEGTFFLRKLPNAVLAFAGLSVTDVAWRTHRAGWSRAELRRQALSRWGVRRLGLLLGALVAYHLVYVCYRNLKSWDALLAPRDENLVAVDAWLFLGHSPNVLVHDLLGTGEPTAHALALVYESFAKLVSFGIVAAPVFVTRARAGMVLPVAGMWAWILGTASYYLVPSLGPVYARPGWFRDLPETVITGNQVEYLSDRHDFLADPHAADTFSSISAFASLHTALSALLLFAALYYRNRWCATVLGAFLLLTLVATVYFGWHYFVDLPAGVLIAAIALFLGHHTVFLGRDPHRRDRRRHSAPAREARAGGVPR